MSANPYVEARGLVEAAHARLLGWIADRLEDAGYTDVTVVDDRAPQGGTTSRLVVWPYRVLPWPRRVESTPDLPLLRVADKQAGVPEPWRELARLLVAALDGLLPQGPGGRILPSPPLSALPAPLAAWYRAAGEPWVVGADGGARARLPALAWRPAFVIRASFLVLAEVPEGGRELGLGLLSVLALAVNRERSLALDLPGPAPDPALDGLVSALCASCPGALAAELGAALEAVRAPARWNLTLVPFPELEQEDLAALARAIGRPLRASVQVGLQIPLGAGPVLSQSSASAVVNTQALGG